MTQHGTFRPDTKTRFTYPDGRQRKILAETISKTGGTIVVTQHEAKDGSFGFGLTHTLTGATLTGVDLWDIYTMKKRARKFWSLLTPAQRKIWTTSNDPETVSQAASREAVAVLRGS